MKMYLNDEEFSTQKSLISISSAQITYDEFELNNSEASFKESLEKIVYNSSIFSYNIDVSIYNTIDLSEKKLERYIYGDKK